METSAQRLRTAGLAREGARGEAKQEDGEEWEEEKGASASH